MYIEKSKLQRAWSYFIIALLLAGFIPTGIVAISTGDDLILWISFGLVVNLLVIAFGSFYVFKLQENVIQSHEERLASIVENAVDGIVVSNDQGIITEVNRAAESIFGYNADEIIGINVSTLMPDPDSRHHDQYIKSYTKGCAPKVIGKGRELKGLRKDGTTFPLNIVLAEIRWGDEKGFTAIVRDINEVKKADVALHESEERYRFFIDNVNEGVLVSAEGKITDASNVLLNMFACKLEDLLGRSPLEHVATSHQDQIQKVMNSRSSETYETTLLRNDGTIFPALLKGRNLTFGGRDVRFTTILDITRQRENEAALRESEERYRFFVDYVDEGIIVVEQGKIIDASSVWLDIIGCKLEDALGRSPLDYTAPFRHDEVKKIIASGKHDSYETDLLCADGTVFPALVRGRILTLDGRSVRLVTILDITKQKENEAALVEAKQKADKANMAKSEFLSSMSHELRTPLNAIMGFAQLLRRNKDNTLTDKQLLFSEEVLNAGKHLLMLIDDILNLSRVEAGEIDLKTENISLTEILHECHTLLEGMASDYHITLIIRDASNNPPLYADYTRTKQVIINLISNAIKYNKEGGEVIVSVEGAHQGMVRIKVTDTGPGIPEVKQSGLFQAFNRLGMENGEVEGTGIGLVICLQLVEAMKGQIGFESVVGKGSTFWIELPIGESITQLVHITEMEVNADIALPELHTILLYIEDNPANLRLLEETIGQMENISMISAHTGELGIEMAKTQKPDLIVLDINLPGMDGFEVLKKLHYLKQTRNTTIIALSALATKDDIEKGLAAGFFRYMTKPIDIKELMKNIAEGLAHKY